MQWGKEKSEQWLLSFFVSFVQDAAISQPVKVALFSAMMAFFLKYSMEQKEKHRPLVNTKTRIEDEKEASYSTQVVSDNKVALL